MTRISRRLEELAFVGATAASFALALAPLGWLLAHAARRAATALVPAILSASAAPSGEPAGLAQAAVGSLFTVALAAVLGLPLGIAAGVFCAESRRGGRAARLAVDLLGGVPPIVVGLFVYLVVVIPMRRHSLLAGAVALALVIVPPVARGTDALLAVVPTSLRDLAASLGLSRWRAAFFALLPAVSRGVLATVGVAVGRALGETAPLLHTSFHAQGFPRGLTSGAPTLPLSIWLQAASPREAQRASAWAAALVLVGLAAAAHVASAWLERRGGGAR